MKNTVVNLDLSLTPPVGISILSNRIFSNGPLGIDLSAQKWATGDAWFWLGYRDGTLLAGDGVTANDPLDLDAGPNNLQNYPVISSALKSGSGAMVSGTLDSAASTDYLIQIFRMDNGELFAETTVTTDGSGNASFAIEDSLAVVPAGTSMAATATRLAAGLPTDTSEFSYATHVLYVSDGYLPPIENPNVVNTGKAGRTYPVKF